MAPKSRWQVTVVDDAARQGGRAIANPRGTPSCRLRGSSTTDEQEAKEASAEREPARILLVSNDESLCGMVRAFLGHAGFCVFVATSAERAERTFLNGCEIDVWMVDVQALGVEAVSVAMQMRDCQPDTPLVIFGAEDSDECSLLEFICEGWARISKPVDLPALLATVHSSLLRVQYGSSHAPGSADGRRAAAAAANGSVVNMYRTWVSAAVALARFKRSQN